MKNWKNVLALAGVATIGYLLWKNYSKNGDGAKQVTSDQKSEPVTVTKA